MDFCPPNAPISATQHHNLTTTQQPPPNGSNGSGPHGGTAAGGGPLSYLLPQQPIEGDETSEWLSVFVEDCFSSPCNYLLAPANDQNYSTTTKSSNPNPNPNETLKPHLLQNPDQNPKTKPRKKPRSIMKLKHHKIPSIFDLHLEDLLAELNPNPNPDPDPPLLHQTHWLADSEPIFPIHQPEPKPKPKPEKENLVDVAVQLSLSACDHCTPQNHKTRKGPKKGSGPRKCSHCQAEKTPLWRQGPSGKGTLCNACGVRWLKSGNLFPEYRPANSPTFVSDLHSNVLCKVLKMREAREAPGGSGLSSSDDH